MASQKQIEANRRNAKHSTGPNTPTGKAKTKLNGLKHGLRSQEVVLPTEDPAEFQAFVDAWMADWQPPTMARAQLVEDAAVAAWRKRRCVRVEAGRIAKRVRLARAKLRRDERAHVASLVARLPRDPGPAVRELLTTRAGVARLVGMWDELAEAAREPGGWRDRNRHHLRLFHLQGREPGDPDLRKAFEISSRLLLVNDAGSLEHSQQFEPYDRETAKAAAATIRELALGEAERLRGLWATLPDDSARDDAQAELDAFEPRPEDAPLLRYEGQLARQFHRSLADLVKLTKSGDDLVEAAEEEADEHDAPSEANSDPKVHSRSGVESESPDGEPAPNLAAVEPLEADWAVIGIGCHGDDRPGPFGAPAEGRELVATA